MAFPSLEKVHIRMLSADTFQNASNLKEIASEENLIAELPKKVFAKCVRLVELDSSKNVIRHIDDAGFSGLNTLQKLHMNNSK